MKDLSAFLLAIVLMSTAGVVYVQLRNRHTVFSEDQIFFVQTRPELSIGTRTECSVESAAFFHPDRHVTVVLALPGRDRPSNQQIEDLKRLKAVLPNIRWIRIDVDSFLRDSPLEYWWLHKFQSSSPFSAYHMSDALRFLLLYRYGGLYLDADMITTQPMPSHPFLAYEQDKEYLMSAVIQLRRADDYTKALLALLPGAYNPNCWACIGPALTTSVHKHLRRYHAFASRFFSPFDYTIAYDTLTAPPSDSLLSLIKEGYAIHLYNRMSDAAPVTRNNTLGYIFAKYCPLTHQRLMTDQFG